MVESGPTCSLIFKPPFVTCIMQILCCKERTKLETDGSKTLMPDVVVPEAHQNNCSYVHELKEPTFNSLRKNLA